MQASTESNPRPQCYWFFKVFSGAVAHEFDWMHYKKGTISNVKSETLEMRQSLVSMSYTLNNNKTAYHWLISVTDFLSNKTAHTLFETSFLLKGLPNAWQAQQINKQFTQLRRQQQLLASIHQTLKSPIFN